MQTTAKYANKICKIHKKSTRRDMQGSMQSNAAYAKKYAKNTHIICKYAQDANNTQRIRK